MNVVLFGAPGAGKGTLAGKIKKIIPIVHVSTGDLFRENVSNETEIGKRAKEYMDAGKLVPDEVVIDMVKDRIARSDVKENGFLLDGFPRTLAQAKSLNEVASLDRVLVIDIKKEELKDRILGRRTCSKCKEIYNVFNPELQPKKEGICDKCGGELTQRKDDNEVTFESRWDTYISQSEDVISYYEEKNIVKHVDGSNTMGLTDEDLKELLAL